MMELDERHVLRNLLWFKIFRLYRIGGQVINESRVEKMIAEFFYKKDKDDQVAFN